MYTNILPFPMSAMGVTEQSDKFEKLFSAYAELAGASRADLLFRFDGDQLSPDSTPEEQGLENDDIVEVYKKGIGKS